MVEIEEVREMIQRGIKSIIEPSGGFNCVKCGVWFVPQKGQWIFHDLCDKCFKEFDEQKMKGRFSWIFGITEPMVEGRDYFESLKEWMKKR